MREKKKENNNETAAAAAEEDDTEELGHLSLWCRVVSDLTTWPLTSSLAPFSGFSVTVPFLLVTTACCGWMLPTQSYSQLLDAAHTIIQSIAGCCPHYHLVNCWIMPTIIQSVAGCCPHNHSVSCWILPTQSFSQLLYAAHTIIQSIIGCCPHI